MGTIKQLRWWGYKILPLVYSDSISYLESQSQVVAKLNEVIKATNEIPDNVSAEVAKQLQGDGDIYENLFSGLVNAIATKEADEVTFTPNEKQGGELIWLGETLYEVVQPMKAGVNYIIGTNIVPIDIDDMLKEIRGYISTHNEYWHERATQTHNSQTYLYWKGKLYRADADINVNDILAERVTTDGVTTGQLTLVNTMDEITNHYLEMHEADNNLQTQIDGNDGDIEKLQNEDVNLQSQITNNNNSLTNRIDNIVAQAGTDNTEIVDARIGATNLGSITYANLGNAVRKQIEKCIVAHAGLLRGVYSAPFDDLDTFPTNTTAWYEYIDNIKHKPKFATGRCSILSYTGSPEQEYGSTQLLYCIENNHLYKRMCWSITGWTEWNSIEDHIITAKKCFTDPSSVEPPYNDFDTIPTNTILWINGTANILHMPSEVSSSRITGCTILTYNSNMIDVSSNNGGVQIATYILRPYNDSNKTECFSYIRMNWGDTWQEWQALTNNTSIKATKCVYETAEAPYDDLNTFPLNSYNWYYNCKPSHCPPNVGNRFTVMSYGGGVSQYGKIFFQTPGTTQFLYDLEYNNIYARACWSNGWTDWVLLNEQANNEIIYKTVVRKPFNFNGKKAIFCGDSITQGFTTGTTMTKDNYVKLFSEQVGLKYTNKALAGSTIYYHENYGYIYDQLTGIGEKPDYIFIAGGVNDWALGSTIAQVEEAIKTYCDYIHSNLANVPVIWITPINEGGWKTNVTPVATLQEYRNAITRAVIENDSQHCFSILQGNEFNFPTSESDSKYISYAFGDKLHPSVNGYANIYVPAMLNALL